MFSIFHLPSLNFWLLKCYAHQLFTKCVCMLFSADAVSAHWFYQSYYMERSCQLVVTLIWALRLNQRGQLRAVKTQWSERAISDLVLPSVVGEQIATLQLLKIKCECTQTHWGCIWDLFTQTTFGDVLGHTWPHSFSSLNVNVSWATLKDCLLNLFCRWNNKK